MVIVIDASVALAWLLKDEGQVRSAREVVTKLEEHAGIVPGIFWYEVRNVLVQKERSKYISQENARRLLSRLGNLPIKHDHRHNEAKVLSLAKQHELSVYDAAYLETAIRRRAQIATFDKALAEAARKERVENRVSDTLI